MKLYLVTDGSDLADLIRIGARRILVSYWQMRTPYARNRILYNIQKYGLDCFLDSGAYSAYNSGVKITLEAYTSFVKQFGKYFTTVASLDVLFNPEQSLDNYNDMLRWGCKNVLPVWHYTEPWSYFDEYCKTTDYICVGGLVGLKRKVRLKAIREVLARIPKGIKIHLFGLTDIILIKKFGRQIDSCDSSTWKSGQRFAITHFQGGGQLFRPRGTDGKEYTPKGGVALSWVNIRTYLELEKEINEYKVNPTILEEARSIETAS